MLRMKKMFKNVIIVGVILYTSITFINQQKTLNAYKNQQNVLSEKIAEQKEYKDTLLATKENISSPDYIEEIAREKLDMYLPNERVYIDMGK